MKRNSNQQRLERLHRCRFNSLVRASLAIYFILIMGCETASLPPVSLDGLVALEEDQAPPVQEMMSDIGRPVDRPPPQDLGDVDPQVQDMQILDMEIDDGPDGEVPMGDRCDPRLRAPACDPGFVCLPVPGSRVYQGRCVPSDDCSIIGESGCPEDNPYCHLRGRATECTQASTRGLGDVCLDEYNRSLPCAEGLVCNFSVCVEPCDPQSTSDEQCGNNRQCVDLSNQLNQNGGFCGAIGSCDLFTNQGCEAGKQCNFAVRADDQKTVYFCSAEGQLSEGDQCSLSGTGADGCGPGLFCINSPEGSAYCKRVCDTGGYQGPCPDGYSCREVLSQGGGFFIRGLGLCVTNP